MSLLRQPHRTPTEKLGPHVVVADDVSFRNSVRELCQAWGLHVECVNARQDEIHSVTGKFTNGESGRSVFIVPVASEVQKDLVQYCLTQGAAQSGRVIAVVDQSSFGLQSSAFLRLVRSPFHQSHLFEALATVFGATLVENVRDSSPRLEAGAASTRSHKPSGWRVLVAEDNEVNKLLIVKHLENFGHRVQVASNGIEALSALKTQQFDLVLMDCQMPEMDGYAATRELRRTERNDERIPVIALTANAMKGDREACIEAGMDDYLSKPVRRNDLGRMLEKWLQSGQ